MLSFGPLIKLYQCSEKNFLHWPKTLRALAEVLDSTIGPLAGFKRYECIALEYSDDSKSLYILKFQAYEIKFW